MVIVWGPGMGLETWNCCNAEVSAHIVTHQKLDHSGSCNETRHYSYPYSSLVPELGLRECVDKREGKGSYDYRRKNCACHREASSTWRSAEYLEAGMRVYLCRVRSSCMPRPYCGRLRQASLRKCREFSNSLEKRH